MKGALPFLLAVLAAGCSGGARTSSHQASSVRDRGRHGRLVLVGASAGAKEASDVYKAILQARDGSGPVCVVPAASGAPVSAMETAQAALDRQGGAGTASTIFLSVEDAARAGNPEIVGEISHCSGFFFTAGEPSRLTDVLMPRGDRTLALQAILARYRHGAVVAAAGETITALGRVMVAGGESQDALADGVTTVRHARGLLLARGLGVFPSAILDSHFLAYGRIGRLLVAVLATDSLPVGLGVDAESALVVDGDSARVLGPSSLVLVDARRAVRVAPYFGRGVRVVLVGDGDRIDLRTLSVERGPGKSAVSAQGTMQPVGNVFGPWGFLRALAGLAGSSTKTVQFTVAGARLTIRKADGFSAASRRARGVQGEPAGMSAGPFVVDLVPAGR